MFKVLVLQTLYALSDERTEYPIRDRLSLLRFCGRGLADRVLRARTIWLCRKQLAKTGAIERLFARLDAVLRDAGCLARPARSWTLQPRAAAADRADGGLCVST